MKDKAARRGIEVDTRGLPPGITSLLGMEKPAAEAGPDAVDIDEDRFLYRVGEASMCFLETVLDMLGFIGETSLAFVRLLAGRARFRRVDFLMVLQDTGAQSLPIVTVIGLLIGIILAFVGVIQLRLFGAQIYVADLVGIATVREMGPLMAAIIMAGRSGAAFAAHLGTMTVNEEVDALKTAGFSPVEFLVLPRVLALTAMLPLLALYTDFMAMVGGAIVGVGAFDISYAQYLEHTSSAVPPLYFALGLIKATIYGALVALAGCYYGIRCGRSASAVGSATTSAVVLGVTLVIIATAVTTIIYDILGV
jgi:phospholipid/cholesterol/gamma-HCH transport system permease protein